MPSIVRSEERGYRDFGWLKARYSFSFGDYYDPGKMGFGALRVLNEDRIAPASGFATHPHHNMEIITLPLEGTLEHRDSMGHGAQLHAGEVQVMSAGTGIYHSERNPSHSEWLHLLQIWVMPDTINVAPRYQQQKLPDYAPNAFFTFLGPRGGGTPFWIHQQAWFSLARLNAGQPAAYMPRLADSGIYVFVIKGALHINGLSAQAGDAIAITEAEEVTAMAHPSGDTQLLLMEVPLRIRQV